MLILIDIEVASKPNTSIPQTGISESVAITLNLDEICVIQNFTEVVIVKHKLPDADLHYYPLSVVHSRQTDESKVAKSCFQVSPGLYSVAVFRLGKNGKMRAYPTKVLTVKVKAKGKELHVHNMVIFYFEFE